MSCSRLFTFDDEALDLEDHKKEATKLANYFEYTYT